jgi:excisionase family DNA binding protein
VSALRDQAGDPLLDPQQAADMLQISAWQIRKMAREREIPAIRLGKFWRFRKSSLEGWLTDQERGAK